MSNANPGTKLVDVIIVGAGISGIGAAWHLQTNCPTRSYVILEGRDAIGGTWDLFRYPGIRSDSDMYTLGYAFKPWKGAKAIADGPAIRDYVQETARDYGIDRKIRFGHRVRRATWSSEDALWTVFFSHSGGAEEQLQCRFLFMCCGYYDYAGGYAPRFPGEEKFAGRIVHPQKWTPDIVYKGKRVVVIGSGATAVTLVPEMAKEAAHVTMLQRSPSYVLSRPSVDPVAGWLKQKFPQGVAYALTRWKNLLMGMTFFNLCRRDPAKARGMLLGELRRTLGPDYTEDYIATHFTPRYNPWEQRLCLLPDGDLLRALKANTASVVTDQITQFTTNGIQLASGAELPADLIVTATGLQLQMLGGMELMVDGKRVDPAQCFNYKGLMYSDVPNFAVSFGYTNASWTLKVDLTAAYVCRVLNHMEKTGTRRVIPRLHDQKLQPEPWVDFSSGYFQRSLHLLPKQGSKKPWKLYQNYLKDLLSLRYGLLEDGVVEFSR